MDWSLSFRHQRSLTVEDCQRPLEALLGPVTTRLGELSGNPRDYYTREILVEGTRGDLAISLRASQSLRGEGDPEACIDSASVKVSAPYATKLATWRALADSFATLGCRDTTFLYAAQILDEVEAAGDTETATRLRTQILGALVAEARTSRWVSIYAPRVDVETILAAYESPETITSMSLGDTRLGALPAGFARFPNLTSLSLSELALDGTWVRGVSLPRLHHLTLSAAEPWRISARDLAGLPALEVLVCNGALEELDPDIVDVCPKLHSVYIENTPLHRDEPRMGALREWPVRWRYQDPIPASRAPAADAATPAVARARAAAPAPVAARPAPLPPRDRVAELRATIATGALRDATRLPDELVGANDDMVEVLATCGALTALVELTLVAVTDAGVLALASKATGLDRLESIFLGDDRDASRISDRAVDTLARSTRLPSLRRISRTITHHVYTAGARDDDEVTSIQRDDGRIVESVLGHSLWP